MSTLVLSTEERLIVLKTTQKVPYEDFYSNSSPVVKDTLPKRNSNDDCKTKKS